MRAAAPRGSAMVTRSWAWRATERDLRTSARILCCAATTLKTKKPATSGILKRKKQATAGMLKRNKPVASASSDGVKILEPSEILKLKKKAYQATRLWEERHVPEALERWKATEAKAEAEEAQQQPKKRKRLVITRLPDDLIHLMKTEPYLIKPIPHKELERLDSMSCGFANIYHMRKFIDDKMYAYEQALINQHNLLGYADDVDEVTDDEQEE